MIKLGLCCIFKNHPIKFRHATAKNLLCQEDTIRMRKTSELCLHNAKSLVKAVEKVHELGFGAFRVQSQLFPVYTHPEAGYQIEQLVCYDELLESLRQTREFAREHAIRLSFHPDQFVVLSSPHEHVVANSIKELAYQAKVADLIGAEVINIHAGGVYGDKKSALTRLVDRIKALPEQIRSKLTLENDDISYAVEDLLPVCHQCGIPLVYDVHHHRCNPDSLSVEEATISASKTWTGRTQHVHISSPKNGWENGDNKPHADYIDIKDFPDTWLYYDLIIDVEAKAKELAVSKLKEDLKC